MYAFYCCSNLNVYDFSHAVTILPDEIVEMCETDIHSSETHSSKSIEYPVNASRQLQKT